MNSIIKAIAPLAALIASLALLWIAFSVNRGIPINHNTDQMRVDVWKLN